MIAAVGVFAPSPADDTAPGVEDGVADVGNVDVGANVMEELRGIIKK